jgi:mono/diheme cytochrome c family protein
MHLKMAQFAFMAIVAMISLGIGVPSDFCGSRATFADQAENLRKIQQEFTRTIRPMIEQHCGDCHWGDDADADLNLEPFETLDQLLVGRNKWKKVLLRVAAKEMPPAECDPIADDQHKQLMQWLDQLMNSVDCTDINPGRVTIRRLNRVEYRNTVKDLIGVDYKRSNSFPGDDVGYGFDNIADVLSLPPILMEKYLQAAEEISFQAINDVGAEPTIAQVSGTQFTQKGQKVRAYDGAVLLHSQSTITGSVVFKETGKYKCFVEACGDQAGNEPCKMSVSLNGFQAKTVAVKTKAGDFEEHEFKFSVNKTGKIDFKISFLNDYYYETDDRKLDRNLFVGDLRVVGPIGKKSPAYKNIINVRPPKTAAEATAAARSILNRVASKAYRRRVTDQELGRLMSLYQQSRIDGNDFDASIRFTLQAILVSPHFLYKVERPVPKGEIRKLNDFELASNLSYFLWSTMPDDELFRVAARGQLSQPDVYRKQVKRMLASRRSLALVQNFASQWLHLRALARMQPDPELFPGVDRKLRADMVTETKLVVADLIAKDGKITELLSVPYTFINESLAKHYGIEGVQGQRFRKFSTAGTGRSGLLTHASILTLTSNPNRTSPVKRGKWIMENLLGEEPPPPDPDAMQLEDQQELTGTLRQRMEQHRSNPNCAVCHRVMDELGFALEHYDPVGRYRQREGENEIDPRGELPNGTKFLGPDELQKTIRTEMRDKFIRCVVEKMLIYSLGRGLEYYDDCTVDQIIEKVNQSDFRFSSLIIAITESQPFLSRSNP